MPDEFRFHNLTRGVAPGYCLRHFQRHSYKPKGLSALAPGIEQRERNPGLNVCLFEGAIAQTFNALSFHAPQSIMPIVSKTFFIFVYKG